MQEKWTLKGGAGKGMIRGNIKREKYRERKENVIKERKKVLIKEGREGRGRERAN